MDSGKPVIGNVHRHMSKCDSCREYAELCTTLKPKFAQDKIDILQDFDDSMNKRIMAAIPQAAASGADPERRARRKLRSVTRPALIPSLAGVFVVLVITIGILFILPRTKQTPSLGQISALISAASPEEVLSKVESPLEKEYVELKRVLESTSKVLISPFDIRIGPQAK